MTEVERAQIRSDLREGFAAVHARCDNLTGTLDKLGTDVAVLRTDVAVVKSEAKAHREQHERDEITGVVNLRRAKDSAAPAAKQRALDMSIVAKIAAGIGIAIAVALSAWTSGTAASTEDVKAAVRTGAAVIIEAAADVAAEKAQTVINEGGVASSEEIQEIADLLRAILEPVAADKGGGP